MRDIERIRADQLQIGDLLIYGSKDAQGNRETAEVITVHGPGVVTYLNRKRQPETIHMAPYEVISIEPRKT